MHKPNHTRHFVTFVNRYGLEVNSNCQSLKKLVSNCEKLLNNMLKINWLRMNKQAALADQKCHYKWQVSLLNLKNCYSCTDVRLNIDITTSNIKN